MTALLWNGLVVEPLPEVSRAVFVATAHRGSFVAGKQIIANLVRKLFIPPSSLIAVAADGAGNLEAAVDLPLAPTAVDEMAPGHPFSRGLQEISLAASTLGFRYTQGFGAYYNVHGTLWV